MTVVGINQSINADLILSDLCDGQYDVSYEQLHHIGIITGSMVLALLPALPV